MTGSAGGLPTPEQRAELVEEVAREILLHGMTGPAVLFLQASMPDGMLPGSAMLFFDPVLRRLFGGDNAPAAARSSPTSSGSSSSSTGSRSSTRT